MQPHRRCSRFLFWGLVGALTFLTFLTPLQADDPAGEVIKDRKAYFPNRRHAEVPGKVIGILALDAQPILSTEGRSGPADQLCFSEGGNSYRWVYVPALENPQITNLQVPVGPKGEINLFPALNMASPKTAARWGITQPYTLIEVSVNTEKGSPANDSFVGTDFKVLEGTKEYPLKATEAVNQIKKLYAEYQKKNEKTFEDALAQVQQRAIKDKKATGPREKEELMYITWLGKEEILEIRFRTIIKDGAYTFIEGGGIGPFDPLPLPLPPLKGRLPIKWLPPDRPEARIPAAGLEFVAFPPPPPPRFKVRVGTGFGIEYGRAYQVDKSGRLVRVMTLPVADFVNEERALPGGPRGPFPLPVPDRKLNPFLD